MAPEKQTSDTVMLEDAQLRKLAKLLLNHEEPLMRRIKSEPERAKYIKQCNDAYENVISLMESSHNFVEKYQKDEDSKDKTKIAKEINEYVKCSINMSMQCVRNCCLRRSYIEKIKTHFDSLVADLDKADETIKQRLTKDVSLYKECMAEYNNKCRSGSARALSKAFSSSLKKDEIKFTELVERQKNKLGFNGEFQNLEEAQRLEVYNSIIEESGRAKIPKIEVASATAGLSLLMVTAGFMVWDILTAEQDIEAGLNNGLSALSEKDAFAVQVGVEEEVAAAVADSELGTFTVSLVGFLAGIIAGLLFVEESGRLVDQILGTGGKAALNLDGLKFHTEKMPDGMSLACETAHES